MGGVLYVQVDSSDAIAGSTLDLLITLADQVGIGLANAQLYAEAQEAQRVAESASQTKSEFLANMSHELRTPLNAILGYAQLLQRSDMLDGKHRNYLETILHSGEHLRDLINEILDMSKIEAGKVMLHLADFDLHQLLDDLERMFELEATAKGIVLRVERDPDLPRYIHTDQGKLRQVLINLLNNAIKFTDQGSVTLACHAHPQYRSQEQWILRFAVIDTGVGISPDELDELFEAFVQTRIGRLSQQGTGLGLPISRQYVQLMGGDISVSSEVGRGSTFEFDIQVTASNAGIVTDTEEETRVYALAPGQPEVRVLVVDDNEENRRLMREMLTPLGFAVRRARNGREAIAIWQEWQPHLIWMDIRMPVLNGYEATERIQATCANSNATVCPVIIAMSASSLKAERDKAIAHRCDDFMRKPFKMSMMLELIQTHLDVQFLQENAEKSKEQYLSPSQHALTQAIAEVPQERLVALEHATLRIDIDDIWRIISGMTENHPVLATALGQWVENYEFERVLDLIEITKEPL